MRGDKGWDESTGTTCVVSWEQRGHLHDTLSVRWLDAAESGVIDIGLVGLVSVSAGDHAAIDTLLEKRISTNIKEVIGLLRSLRLSCIARIRHKGWEWGRRC